VSIRFPFLTVFLWLLACTATPGAAAATPMVIGQAIDLSGPNGSIGRDYVAGITTYFDSLNVAGGINGRKIEYVARDDRGVPAEAAKLVTGLIEEKHVDYLLGGIGSETTRATLAAPAFAGSRHLLFAPLADSAGSANARVLYWRPSMEHEFLFLLVYFHKLGVKEVAIALQDSPQNNKAFQFLSAEIRKRGMHLAGVARISADGATLQAESQRLSTVGATLVITIGDTVGSAQFLRAFRRYDIATFVAGTSLINLTTLGEIAGPRATEFTVFSQVVPNPAGTATMLQAEHIKLMKQFRDEPVSSVTLEGFAVAKTLVRLLRMEGKGKQQGLAATLAPFDLGGMQIGVPDSANNLSRYVDIALFSKGGGLLF
jgi:branched-chain amino acid transport system substrate-binding protein